VDTTWKHARVLITGVCGTIGQELLRQIVARDPREVIGIDNNETEIFFLSEEYRESPNVRLYLGDVRDRDKLMRAIDGIEIVLHAAALKHVILCEQSPRDPLQTNIVGTQNVIDAAIDGGARRVIFTSSDKAVNPTNVMGTSKLMGERLVTAANALRRGAGPVFASTRFGNVLGSRGSVMPIFHRQIARGGPVTITDPRMTRFIMTVSEAVRLVMESVHLARGGEVFVTKMPVVRIIDLAHVMIAELAPRYGHDPTLIEIETIGSKSGEKLHEELMSEEETRRTMELERYFAVIPAFKTVYGSIRYDYADVVSQTVDRAYNSALEPPLSREELRAYLVAGRLLQAEESPRDV
jgi:FlaA1/EpsC-like NDP-sugar epimerase